MTDMLEGLRQFLLADPTVATLTQGNVFEPELPTSSDLSMPSKTVVIRRGGGPGRYDQGTLQINDSIAQILTYGETAHLANVLDEAVHGALKQMTPGVWAQTYFHWAKPSARGIGQRDPMQQWPYVVSRWQVLVSDITVAP